ncbi:hypothetical protein GJW-30_1_02259 [Variibacter gotjawalensis]|uniref:Serralysin n=1 Tax=Variibacter gotjawalensis TaxID=1333996 RepID=A0A0S3PV75_9BRAD|nr:hypothetical protein GJW-30_1_02259 [Variibacter gotjawalensis]
MSWVAYLNAGNSRESVVSAFSESVEHISLKNAALQSFIEITAWQWNDKLDAGTGSNTLIGGLGADDFVFDANSPSVNHIYGFDQYDQAQFANFGYMSDGNALFHMTQIGRDVVFNDHGVTVFFHDKSLAAITAHDWVI